jgi:hypothetical protein
VVEHVLGPVYIHQCLLWVVRVRRCDINNSYSKEHKGCGEDVKWYASVPPVGGEGAVVTEAKNERGVRQVQQRFDPGWLSMCSGQSTYIGASCKRLCDGATGDGVQYKRAAKVWLI